MINQLLEDIARLGEPIKPDEAAWQPTFGSGNLRNAVIMEAVRLRCMRLGFDYSVEHYAGYTPDSTRQLYTETTIDCKTVSGYDAVENTLRAFLWALEDAQAK